MATKIQASLDELQYGTQLGNYIIQSVLGRGAFGITYLAIDNLDRKVAIKEYLPAGFSKRDQRHTVSPLTEDNQELFQYGLDCFLDEAKTVGKFNHPNIVRVLAYFEENQTAYMVMEYELGQDLKAYLEKYPKLSERRLLEIFCPINDGLIKVHEHGYIHRDIKPANIYIRKDESPVLLDFGAARDVFNSKVDQLTRIMTPGYAPYEQDNPSWADQGSWTDIYALGATLYYAMLNERIVAAQERASAIMLKTDDPYKDLINRLNDKYTPHFLRAIDHALAFHPTNRPQTVKEWNHELLGNERSDEDVTRILSPKMAARVESETTVQLSSEIAKPKPNIFNTETVSNKTKNIQVDRIKIGGSENRSKTKQLEENIEDTRSEKSAIRKKKSNTLLFTFIALSFVAIGIGSYTFLNEDNYKTFTTDKPSNTIQTINAETKSEIKSNQEVAVTPIVPIDTIKSPNKTRPDTDTKKDNNKESRENQRLSKGSINSQLDEIIYSKAEIALTHLISASGFYMRANIKQKAIDDFQKDEITSSSKIVTTLKLQHNSFMNKFKEHFDSYIKYLGQLKKYNQVQVSDNINKIMSEAEHANKSTHIKLGEFFTESIKLNNTEIDSLDKSLKTILQEF